ncbi:zf-HC2 domain-containing protein [Paenibacillus allorhizosphaerae]|uniref:Putative zinc-finger domain-containing protein n=1 Tax=Paenibacillus allorhizosphaerae TaxID=2849866 RepID=A0ABN7TL12_9BACL|nr:zf-HC2 domain-containing protein [Paenibacillus allorhizosphaerae]CAG7634758.1 hypothetical protein PAECIP111802_02063 [Paenibacillus allorhizosphaerae]
MMCQEVIELMQRYLDRDLEETEYRRMLQHLQQCPDCTELFERLVNLSHELESLPKVTPPFSLVDAIMPKLEQLEASGETQDFRLAQHAGADADMNAAAAERKAPGGWRKSIKDWISFPVFGGVVAAGLVVGFFLFGQPPSSEKDAGRIMLSLPNGGSEQKAGSAADSGASVSTKAAPLQERPPGDAKPEASGGNKAEKKDAAVVEKFAPADATAPAAGGNAVPPSSPAPQTQKPSPKTVEPQQKASEPAGKAQPQNNAAERNVTPSTPAPGANAEQQGVSATREQAEPEQPQSQPLAGIKPEDAKSLTIAPKADGSQKGGETADSGVTPEQPPAADADQRPADAVGPKLPSEKSGTGAYGIAAMPSASAPVTEVSTTDGAYKAMIKDGRVIVYDKQGKEAYASKYEWKDGDFKVELADWSAEYKLTYRVKASDQVKTFVIAMKNLTETESKP